MGLGAAVGAAVLLHRWVERPAIRLSRALTTGSRAEVSARVTAFAGRWRPSVALRRSPGPAAPDEA